MVVLIEWRTLVSAPVCYTAITRSRAEIPERNAKIQPNTFASALPVFRFVSIEEKNPQRYYRAGGPPSLLGWVAIETRNPSLTSRITVKARVKGGIF